MLRRAESDAVAEFTTRSSRSSSVGGCIHDLHATMLHLLGIDHTKLTWNHVGPDFRLTDVHGSVVKEILS